MKPRGAIAILATLLLALVPARSLRGQGGGDTQQVGGNVNLPSGGDVEVWDGHVPQTRLQMRDLGMLEVAWMPYAEWKGFTFDAMVAGADGSLFLGNSEHRSRLFIYNP